MRNATDSFLHLIADNLPALKVHPLRTDHAHPENETLQMNAVNIEFTIADLRVQVSQVYASIDVINDDELVARDWALQIAQLLQQGGIAPEMDYSGLAATPPTAAVPTGANIFWNPNAVRFRPVNSGDSYFRFNCTLVLNFNNS